VKNKAEGGQEEKEWDNRIGGKREIEWKKRAVGRIMARKDKVTPTSPKQV